MHYLNKTKLVLTLVSIFFISVSAKVDPNKVRVAETCEKVIKYYIKAGKENDKELKLNAEITVNPINLININLDLPNQPNSKFDIIIDSFDCDLNADLTKGSALYKGYIKHENGSATNAMIKISRDENGKLTISNADPEQASGLILYVDRWEVFEN